MATSLSIQAFMLATFGAWLAMVIVLPTSIRDPLESATNTKHFGPLSGLSWMQRVSESSNTNALASCKWENATGFEALRIDLSKTLADSLPRRIYAGRTIILFGGPVFFIVFVGVIYISIFREIDKRARKRKNGRVSLSKLPLIVNGPFGIWQFSEVLCQLLVLGAVILLLTRSLFSSFENIDHDPIPPHHGPYVQRWHLKLEHFGLRLGFVGTIIAGVLFIPVSRGSVILRLLEISFEHAAAYHVWLGHLTMILLTLHGFAYISAWTLEGRLMDSLLEWKSKGVANLAGEISLASGLLMWMSSFYYVRQRYFERFFYTHHLYVVFVIFLALHVGDFVFGIAFAGIFLFVFDRFLRFLQSRRAVALLSARVLPCGSFELVLPRPPNLKYTALSFFFLNAPGLSWLQWHPFSVSSSPRDNPYEIKIVAKPLGSWTHKLKESVVKCPFGLQFGVEGPYGQDSSSFLSYEALILVAGGIGVTPFLAIIRDLLQRYQCNECDLPSNVTLIWAVKTYKELSILDLVCPSSICPNYSSRLHLTVKAYVTKQCQADPENGESAFVPELEKLEHSSCQRYETDVVQRPISHLFGSGNVVWAGAAIAASLLGYLLCTWLTGIFYLTISDGEKPWWFRGLLLILCMLLGVTVFGGIVIAIWYSFGETHSTQSEAHMPMTLNDSSTLLLLPSQRQSLEELAEDAQAHMLLQYSDIVYGSRPDFQGFFETYAKQVAGKDIGVFVSGPESLQSSVSTQLRYLNTLGYNSHRVAFSYHKVSFDF